MLTANILSAMMLTATLPAMASLGHNSFECHIFITVFEKL